MFVPSLKRDSGAQPIIFVTITILLCLVSVSALQGKTNLVVDRARSKEVHKSGLKISQSGNRGPSDVDETAPRKSKKGKTKLKSGSKAKYRANGKIMPKHWVRSMDPDHPNMRTYIDRDAAHTLSLMPENTFWKDHDSEEDEGHPNWNMIRLEAMNSSECERDIWTKIEDRFDFKRWTDDNYNETIAKYGLQSFDKIKHTVPKLWFEPFSSDELEEDLEDDLVAPSRAEFVPHYGEPFCLKCESMLGLARPSLRLDHDRWDPRCRQCGFLNAHGPDGKLLCDPEITVTQGQPSDMMWRLQEEDMQRHIKAVNALDSDGEEELRVPDLRLKIAQRCDECGHNEAYYRTAQVRGADEGQTAFFQCVRCKHQWSVKG